MSTRTRCLQESRKQDKMSTRPSFTRCNRGQNNPITPTRKFRGRRELQGVNMHPLEEFLLKTYKDIFIRLSRSKNHRVHTVFKQLLIPIKDKGRRIPIHKQVKVGEEIKRLIREGHIVKLNKCTSEFLCSTCGY